LGKEKRRFKRLVIRIPAQMAALEAEVLPLDTTIVNLGPEGAYCEAPECLPQGTAVQVTFVLPDSNRQIQADSQVRWVQDDSDRKGMGVQFTRISKEEKDAVYRYILLKLAQARGIA
jgi:uncharacterized protein (TIGR02266 family)